MPKGFVYILKCLKNNKTYIGSTGNVLQRLRQHVNGKVSATRNIRPVVLVFTQEYENFSLARKAEFSLKRFKRKDFIEKIVKDGIIKKGR